MREPQVPVHLKAGWARGLPLSAAQRDRLVGYFFIAPSVIGFSIFVLGPVFFVVWFSLHDFDLVAGTFDFVGAGNYGRLMTDPLAQRVLVNTAVFAVGSVPLQMLLGLGLAVLINRQYPGVRFFRSAYFIPTLITLVAWAIVWNFLLQKNGGINGALSTVGVDGPNWLREPGWAMAWLIVSYVFKTVGVTMVLFLAALQSVPGEVIEAAKVDGAGSWSVFRYVTMPLIAPFTFLILIHATISSFKTFELVFLLTGGGPGDATSVMVHFIYTVGFRFFEQGYASAAAVGLFAVTFVLTVLQFAARSRWVHGER